MARQTPFDVAMVLWRIIYQVALKICLFLLIMAIFDYLYQRWEYRKSLRMTKREVKDEYKQTEGAPLVRSSSVPWDSVRSRSLLVTSRFIYDTGADTSCDGVSVCSGADVAKNHQ